MEEVQKNCNLAAKKLKIKIKKSEINISTEKIHNYHKGSTKHYKDHVDKDNKNMVRTGKASLSTAI